VYYFLPILYSLIYNYTDQDAEKTMGFLKQLLGAYMSGNHGGNNKHGRGFGGKHGNRSGYSEPFSPMENKSGTVCSRCNTANVNGAKFCQQCGGAMAATECSQCKTTLLPDAKFCPQCGKARV
jgi:membrane protease subunit (stomatin/prohibitin family)